MEIVRTASANWKGSIKEGKGTLSTESGVLDNAAYSFHTRFENEKGSNPEELIGAAHAGCFSMQLAANLTEAGFEVKNIDTSAKVYFKNKSIVGIKLETKVGSEGLSMEKLTEIANDAKMNCPVSRLLETNISLDVNLV